VCVVLSLFNQLTVVPVETVIGLAPNAAVVNVELPLGIEIVVAPAGAALGELDGDEGEPYPPHAAMDVPMMRNAIARKDMT
jgi:hypothetical protein